MGATSFDPLEILPHHEGETAPQIPMPTIPVRKPE
jgi:hypothetical protein